jgi:hypothetical protein
VDKEYINIRAGSRKYASGGTIHQVIGGHIHDSYNPKNGDYDIAVLQVCTDSVIQ